MKILIATGIYPPDIGGPATFVKELARLIAEEGHFVSVVSYGEEDKNFIDGKVPVTIVSRRRGRAQRYMHFFKVLRQLSKDCDLIYAQDLISSGLPAALNNLLVGRSYIIRLGGDFLWEQAVERNWTDRPLAEYYNSPKLLHEKIYLWMYNFVLTRSSFVIFNSKLLRDLYNKTFKLVLEKTTVIHNAQPQKSAASQNVDGNFIFVGRFVKVKNIHRLLYAFRALSGAKVLDIIGHGPLFNEYNNTIQELGLQNRVKVSKAVTNDRLKEILAKARVVVIPSLTEINPNIALEAIACGVPVVLTKYNGLATDVASKLWTFDPLSVDGLTSLLERINDPKQYEDYKKVIESIALTYTWDVVVKDHLKLFARYANS